MVEVKIKKEPAWGSFFKILNYQSYCWTLADVLPMSKPLG
jgi:hypothetical protein